MEEMDTQEAKKFILDQVKFKQGVHMLVILDDFTTRMLHSLDESSVFNASKGGYSGWVTGDRNVLERLSAHLAETHNSNKIQFEET